MGITNIISRAELASVATAIINSYFNLAADSLTKNSSHIQSSTTITSREVSSNPLPKQNPAKEC
jgi:hypothetical protein